MWGNLLNFGSILVLCPIGFLGISGFLFYLLCLLFQCLPTITPPPHPQQLSNHSFLSFGVSFQLFYLYQCLLLLPQLRAGKKNVLSLCSRQIFLLGNGLRRGGEAVVFPVMFQFLASNNWICSREWERQEILFQSDVGNKDEWRPELWFLPWYELPLRCYVNLLNFELFHYL